MSEWNKFLYPLVLTKPLLAPASHRNSLQNVVSAIFLGLLKVPFVKVRSFLDFPHLGDGSGAGAGDDS